MLMGHSQGGQSIFNALLINQNLCKYLVQERPVCGDTKRFNNFNIPTLLVYDTEDSGHPIKQGYALTKVLKTYEFISYNGNVEPYFQDILIDLIILFLFKYRSYMSTKELELYNEAFISIDFNEIANKINNISKIKARCKKRLDRNFCLEKSTKSEISKIKKAIFKDDVKEVNNNSITKTKQKEEEEKIEPKVVQNKNVEKEQKEEKKESNKTVPIDLTEPKIK